MDTKIAGLIGAMTALTAAAPMQAASAAPVGVAAAMQANSYADLLKPIPDAVALLRASDAQEAQAELLAPAVEGDATIQTVQYHHHHHHHHFGPRFGFRFHHHHHHHHHFRHHHHHHHFRDYGY